MNPGLLATVTNEPAAAVDPAAESYIAAAGITDPSQRAAINTFVINLKADGVYAKMQAIYPFMGGTAASHKWNLVNPLDTNGAFRLTFGGAWTHNANGITANGIDTYADTHYVQGVNATTTSGSFGVYSRTESEDGGWDMGVTGGGGANTFLLSRRAPNEAYMAYGSGGSPSTNTSSLGLLTTNRNSATNTTGYRNATLFSDIVEAVSLSSTVSLMIACLNNGGVPIFFSSRNYAFAFLGTGLTAGDIANLSSRVQTLQTALGRAV